jgi:hypothetical protein
MPVHVVVCETQGGLENREKPDQGFILLPADDAVAARLRVETTN